MWNDNIVAWYQNIGTKIHIYSREVTRSLEDGKQKQPIPSLDGVRGLACLGVVLFHLNLWALFKHIWFPYLDNVGALISSLGLIGESGVLLFFVLSGFLLFLPFANSMLFDRAWPSLRRFYIRRIFRIFPGYYFALCLMLLYLNPLYLQASHWSQLWLFITFQMDLPQTYQQLNIPFWTLAIEFQFYMFLPLIAWLMGCIVRRGSLKLRMFKLTCCLLVMFTWGMLTRYWGFKVSNTHQWDFMIPHAVADALRPYIFGSVGKFFESFALGMLVCMVYVYLQHDAVVKRGQIIARRLSPILFGLGVVSLFLINVWHYYVIFARHQALHFLDPYQHFLVSYRDIFMQVGYSIGYALCLFGILCGPALLRRPFAWTPLRWLGFISFSLYIWHYPFIVYVSTTIVPRFQLFHWSLLVQYSASALWIIVTAIPLSVVLYLCIERPGIRLGEQLCQLFIRQKPPVEIDIVIVPTALKDVSLTTIPRQEEGAGSCVDWSLHLDVSFCALSSSSIGNVTTKLLPSPATPLLLTQIEPPCKRRNSATTYKPNPMPPA
jgi:peptidoglycan/LPS O-acetylase OafA/YrhL